MGRGRAKAKQTKVARQLKYSSSGTDLDALKAELSGAPVAAPAPTHVVDDPDELEDPYAKYVLDEDDDDGDEDDESR